ncbi:hypothetical protein [Azospirillum halopraeferens]|uniref:hypothetical protein n=1 Tax=Azospirillum halopraeferens TaxID=34010 RepID=UPI0004907404|nr:hypothetical protein [Azospirillum halopraeferens]
MADIHRLRRTPPPRRPNMSCDTLARLTFLGGGVAAFLSYFVGLGGFSTLIGLGISIGGYAAFYDRCR